jgi:hypothetical protein
MTRWLRIPDLWSTSGAWTRNGAARTGSGMLEVYPIAHYGAADIGVRRFHHPGHEDAEGGRGEVHPPVAGDEWDVEGDAGDQLRSSWGG